MTAEACKGTRNEFAKTMGPYACECVANGSEWSAPFCEDEELKATGLYQQTQKATWLYQRTGWGGKQDRIDTKKRGHGAVNCVGRFATEGQTG